MDFFEAQDRAKKRTTRLVILFIFAVIGTIGAGYAAALVILAQVGPAEAATTGQGLEWWQPRVLLGVAVGTVVVVTIASAGKWASLRAGGAAVAEMVGGRRVSPNTTDAAERRLLNIVEEMAIASGTPLPAVFLLPEEPAINAFAAGLTTSDAAVAVTRGALERLSRDELQGVIGHEFSHILNGDMRLNLKLTSVVFGILVIALLGQTLLRSLRFAALSGGRGRRDRQGGAVFALLALGAALMVVGYIGYFFGRLIQAAVSRQREYLADAAAVQFTRYPAGIAGALKKIGGLALGSRLAAPAAAQINHSLFGQNFGRGLTGAFATHPPLPERIRAIEPGFDGKFIEAPTTVDVSRESFRSAGFGPVQAERLRQEPGAAGRIPVTPAAVVRNVGLPTPAHVEHAQRLLAALPTPLVAAAHDPALTRPLVYALLLDANPDVRQRQCSAVAAGDPGAEPALAQLVEAAVAVPPESRLPLLQLALGSMRDLTADEVAEFVATLDALVHADHRVTTFEYAMQKMVAHHLKLARRPAPAGGDIFSFNAVASDIEVVLSALARAAAPDEAFATRALAAGAAQLRMLEEPLGLLPAATVTLERLDAAVERLTRASFPIKKRLIDAAAHVVGADNSLRYEEAELLRAICSTLDCPLPPMI